MFIDTEWTETIERLQNHLLSLWCHNLVKIWNVPLRRRRGIRLDGNRPIRRVLQEAVSAYFTFFYLGFWPCERPVSFQDLPPGSAAGGRRNKTGSEADWTTAVSTKHFAKPQGSETLRGFVYSFFSCLVEFSSSYATDRFSVCTDHHRHYRYNNLLTGVVLCCDLRRVQVWVRVRVKVQVRVQDHSQNRLWPKRISIWTRLFV